LIDERLQVTVELTARALHELAETVALIEPGHWESPTPCELWDVRELLEHIVAVNRKYEHIPAGDPWLPGLKDVDLGDNPARTYRESIAPFLAAWRRPDVLNQTVLTQGDRQVAAELVLLAHLRETLVHGWDLAVSIGRAAPFDDAVVRACLESVARTPEVRPDGIGYADAVPAPPGSPPIVELAARYGRDVVTWSRGSAEPHT
jgi:uncharacterized protein (TIGR03086 family)